jgi:tRNA pseudouridine38-40 synthase
MRYFLELSYCGSRYNGWQSQAKGKGVTIQSAIESALSTLLRKETPLTGCGRTDSGVHALHYFAHFDTDPIKEVTHLIQKLNKMLNQDIVIHNIHMVDDNAHARFDAVSRSYRYQLHIEKSPFLPFSFYYRYGIPDINILNSAASVLLKYHDFATFCKTHTDTKTTICNLTESHWNINDSGQYTYHITGDRFLRGMVRLIVGMCLNITRNKLSLEAAEDAVSKGIRTGQDWSVPPQGLFLTDVKYPYL